MADDRIAHIGRIFQFIFKGAVAPKYTVSTQQS